MKKFILAVTMLTLAVTIAPTQAQTFKPLHQFDSDRDGAFSEGAVLRDAAGNLYGTTTSGALGFDNGIVFKIDSTGRETVLFAFDDFVSGTFPTGNLIQDAAGNLYGIAEGGPGGAGVAYKLSPQGEQTLLFSFQGGLHNHTAKGPAGGLFMDKAGNILGTAQFGSDLSCQLGCGSVFRLDTTGKLHLLHKFTSGAQGSSPIGPLVQDAAGNLYGVAQSGGDLSCPEFFLFPGTGCGVVFKLGKNLELTVLHAFKGGKDGAVPQAGLLLDASGNLFGTALKGGNSENGTVFKISANGIYRVLHRFSGKDGTNPNGSLVSDPDGNLYGTAQLGGTQNLGTAFQLSPIGELKVLHNFKGLKDGASPFAGLTRDQAGHLYGTTVKNFLIQQIQGGSVFEITP
jgi:uncharacterized repeat protein (TIGR03803 family)